MRSNHCLSVACAFAVRRCIFTSLSKDVIRSDIIQLHQTSGADQWNHFKTNSTGPLYWFPAATDEIVRMSQKVDVFLRPSVSWLVHLLLSLGTPFCLYRSVSQLIGPLSSVCRRTFLSLSVSQSVGLFAHLYITVHLFVFVGQLVSWFVHSPLYHGAPFCLCRSVS